MKPTNMNSLKYTYIPAEKKVKVKKTWFRIFEKDAVLRNFRFFFKFLD